MDRLRAQSGGDLPPSAGSFDGRETECLAFVRARATEHSPAAVVKAIDEFCYTTKWMMNVGDVKGRLLDEALERAQPKLVLELGCYVGYSALRMIQRIPSDGRIVSVEISKRAAAIAREMFDVAGVGSRITVVVGHLQDEGSTTCRALETEHGVTANSLDFVFVDHAKEAYLPDLKLILSRKWLKPGSVIVADNVLFPGAPDYREFMERNNGVLFQTKTIHTLLEYQSKMPDIVLESTFLGYQKGNL